MAIYTLHMGADDHVGQGAQASLPDYLLLLSESGLFRHGRNPQTAICVGHALSGEEEVYTPVVTAFQGMYEAVPVDCSTSFPFI